MENGEQDFNDDNDLLDDFNTGVFMDDFEEVEEVEDVGSYFMYSGSSTANGARV